jgi:hypothetical protein
MSKLGSILREIFSGSNGQLSSKRTIGGFAMAVALFSTIYLVVIDRGTEVVENLLTTILILSSSLLGLPAITGVFGKTQITSMGSHKEEDKEEYNHIAPKHPEPDPCERCPHNHFKR